jgi:hypothetical protein
MKDVKIDLEDYITVDEGPFIVAAGSYGHYEPFRVLYMNPEELRLELRDRDDALGGEVWISVSRYCNKLRSGAFDVNGELFKMRLQIYKHLLHELLEVCYGDLKYPFEIYKKDYMGAWRIICIAPNKFKWDDVVENNMKEKVFVARAEPNGAEGANIESACLYFLKKIIVQAKKVVDTKA